MNPSAPPPPRLSDVAALAVSRLIGAPPSALDTELLRRVCRHDELDEALRLLERGRNEMASVNVISRSAGIGGALP